MSARRRRLRQTSGRSLQDPWAQLAPLRCRVRAATRDGLAHLSVVMQIAAVLLLELTPRVLARALEPFPFLVRTLDALHLASLKFLRTRDQALQLASYAARMLGSARKLAIPIYPL